MTLCGACGDSIIDGAEFQLAPCKCVVCPKCMVSGLMTNPRFHALACPCCCNQVIHHSHMGDTVLHDDRQAIRERDPSRWFASQQDNDGQFLLSIVYTEGSDLCQRSSLMDEEAGPMDDNEKQNLLDILALLRLGALAGFRKKSDLNSVPELTPFQWKRYALFYDDRFLTQLIYTLLMGGHSIEKDRKFVIASQDTTGIEKEKVVPKIIGASIIADVVLRQLDRFHPQRFQTVLGNALSSLQQSWKLQRLMTSCRLSIDRTTTGKRNISKAVTYMKKGIQLHPRGYAHWMCDNIEMYGKKRVDSWIHILCANIPEKCLSDDGAYSEDEERRWVRDDKKDWDTLVADEGADALVARVFLVSDEEWLLFSNRQIGHLNAIKCARLPDGEEMLRREEETNYAEVGALPLNFGVPLDTPTSSFRKRGGITDDEAKLAVENAVPAIPRPRWESMYTRNFLEVQNPYHANLARKEIVHEISKSVLRSYENVTKKLSLNDKDNKDGQSIVNQLKAMCADGSPTYLYLCLRAELQRRGDHSLDDLEWIHGDFHQLINGLRNLNGKHSKEVYCMFAGSWRETAKQLDYGLNCPDPRDIWNEIKQHYVAQYRNAADNFAALNGKDIMDVSARDVHDHMLRRAEKYPLCMAILIHLKFSAVLMMLHDAWRSGDHGNVVLRIAALKYLTLLDSISNAPKYMRMNCHFLKWHECASSCQKEIYARYLYTKISPNGELWPTDLGMEKSILQSRGVFGRHLFNNFESRFRSELPSLPSLSQQFGNEKDGQLPPYNERSFVLGEAFVKSYNVSAKFNLWGEGDPNVDDVENLFVPNAKGGGGSYVGGATCKSMSIATARTTEYTKCYEVEDPLAATRNKVSLKCFGRSKTNKECNREDVETKLVSTDKAALKQLGTQLKVDEIKAELDLIAGYFGDDFAATGVEYKRIKSKDELIEALVELRLVYFEDNPDALEERRDTAESYYLEHIVTSEEARKEEIDIGKKLYALHLTAQED